MGRLVLGSIGGTDAVIGGTLIATRVCVCFSIILHSARWPEESAIYYSTYGMSSTQLKFYMIYLEDAMWAGEKNLKPEKGGGGTTYCG